MLNYNIAVVFPGMGSQTIGMLMDYAEEWEQVETTFGQASEVLGYDLWDIVCNGPQEKLNEFSIAQTATLAADISVSRILREQCMLKPYALAGHGMGEYAALVGADVLDFKDAVKLVAARARLMQEAVPEEKGAMATVIGLYDEAMMKCCAKASKETGAVVEVVNFNSPGQVVIAGDKEAVEHAIDLATGMEDGAKKATLLPDSVPSHSSLMKPAADEMAKLLADVEVNTPVIQVIHNVDARSHDDADAIRDALVRQIHSPVRWMQIIKIIMEDADAIIECGPGRVLTGLNKRIDKEIHGFAMDRPASMQKFLDSM